MLGFFKKLFGAKTEETVEQAPYKVEAPVVEAIPTSVNTQITDAVTQSPVVETKHTASGKASQKRGPKKKPAGQKPAVQKSVAPKQSGGRGRKPKAKTQ